MNNEIYLRWPSFNFYDDCNKVFRAYETDTIGQHCSKLEVILSPLVSIVNSLQSDLESRAKIGELTREMPGFPSNPGRFVLQGILLKLSRRRGLQNRILFLVSFWVCVCMLFSVLVFQPGQPASCYVAAV